MTDTGLMATQLQLTADRLMAPTSPQAGPLLETFVYNEIARQASASVHRFEIYHYRDDRQREVDMILEGPGEPSSLSRSKPAVLLPLRVFDTWSGFATISTPKIPTCSALVSCCIQATNVCVWTTGSTSVRSATCGSTNTAKSP